MSSSDGIPVDVMVVDGEEGEIRQPGGRLDCFVAAFLLNEDIVELKVPWESVPGQLCDVMRLPRSAVVFLHFVSRGPLNDMLDNKIIYFGVAIE